MAKQNKGNNRGNSNNGSKSQSNSNSSSGSNVNLGSEIIREGAESTKGLKTGGRPKK